MVALFFFLLRLLLSPFRPISRLEAENAALRRQLIVLQRQVLGRVQFTNSDRLFFLQLYRWFPSIVEAMTTIRPETLVRWHRAGFRHYWRWKSQSLGGRPPIDAGLRALIRRMCFGVRRGFRANCSGSALRAFPWNEAPRYLIRDQDAIYGTAVSRRLRAMGIRDKPIAPGSPWQNGYAERLIGTIRRECLDHLIVLGEAHLRWILGEFVAYYNKSRTHRALSQDAPVHRAIERLGAITSRPVLGGLHHQYCRI
jgi:Integrase core domain